MQPASDRRATATIEFAFWLPIVLLLMLCTVDVVELLRKKERVESATMQLGQLVSQCNDITTADVSQFWVYAQRLIDGVSTVGTGGTGAVVISAVYSSNGVNRVAWQARSGSAAFTSRIGTTAGGSATLAGGLVVPASQTLFTVEYFVRGDPWFLSKNLLTLRQPKYDAAGQATVTSMLADLGDMSSTVSLLSRSPSAVRLQTLPRTSPSLVCTA